MQYHRTQPYRNACTLQGIALAQAESPTAKGFDIAALIRGWIELERLKREMKGIPALSAASLKELLAARRDAARTIDTTSTSSEPFTEAEPAAAEPSKESLNPETVTAPPAQVTP